jgi:hypothetical protein
MGLILYYPGFKNNSVWNNNAVETQCTVIGQMSKDVSSFCGKHGGNCWSYDCNCQNVCTGGSCHQECGSCHAFYQNGWIKVAYLESLTADVMVLEWDGWDHSETYKYASKMIAKLQELYPLNSTLPCYYQRDDPTNFKLFLDPVLGFFVTSIVFFALIGVVLIIWSVIETIQCVRRLNVEQKNIEMNEK